MQILHGTIGNKLVCNRAVCNRIYAAAAENSLLQLASLVFFKGVTR